MIKKTTSLFFGESIEHTRTHTEMSLEAQGLSLLRQTHQKVIFSFALKTGTVLGFAWVEYQGNIANHPVV